MTYTDILLIDRLTRNAHFKIVALIVINCRKKTLFGLLFVFAFVFIFQFFYKCYILLCDFMLSIEIDLFIKFQYELPQLRILRKLVILMRHGFFYLNYKKTSTTYCVIPIMIVKIKTNIILNLHIIKKCKAEKCAKIV